MTALAKCLRRTLCPSSRMKKFNFIYKTTCTITGKWYIGMHSTDNLDDGYLGSGRLIQASVKKHGRKKHVIEILEHLPSREALIIREEELVTADLRSDPLCMNLRNGGTGNLPGVKQPEHSQRLRSESLKKTYSDPSVRARKLAVHGSAESRAKNRAAQIIAQNRPEVKTRKTLLLSKPCSIGVEVFPSLKALVAVHGQGKHGMKHPEFRYIV